MKKLPQQVPVTGDRFVPWRTKLPVAWPCRPVKYVCQINSRALDETTDPETHINYIDISSVTSDGAVTDTVEMTFADAPSRARRILKANDVFISTVRTYLTAIGFCEPSLAGHICSTGFTVLTPGPEVCPRFLYYWVRSSDFVGEIVARSTGVSYPAINASEIGTLPFPTLPKTEQQVISDFLDHKTAQIDSVIAKKQRMIELLHEKQQALISEAVTTGLNHDVPTKDSGIEWIGRIPAHWKLIKTGQICRVVRGGSPRPAGSPVFFNGEAAPWITVAEVTKDADKFLTRTETRLTPEGQSRSRFLDIGTLIMTNSGATLGVPKVLSIAGCINDGSVAFLDLRKEVERDFLFYYLSSLTQMLRQRAEGQGQPNLNTGIVRSIPLPLPPREEQCHIVSTIERMVQRNALTIAKNWAQVEKLREYRQTLVSAAVTGQMELTRTITQPTTKPASKPNPYFRRTVLAAEIIDKLCAEPTFGQVKFQKCLFVAQHHLHLADFEENYKRAAAGPYDNQMIRSVESQLQKQKWFRVEQTGDRYVYKRMDRAGDHKKYFEGYFGDKADQLNSLIDLLKPLDTDRAEIVATLYAVWNDFILLNEPFDDDRIVREVLTNWDESKKRFPEDRWKKALGWMREKGLVPMGFGKPTISNPTKSARGK